MAATRAVDAHGVELHAWESGSGPAAVCLHETATTSEVWQPLAAALGDRRRTISYDRRGWGGSAAPQSYTATTVEEQAEDAAVVLESLEASPAVLCGAGLGAVAALQLLLRRPELVAGAVLVEPPLLAFVPEATKVLGDDRIALEEAVRDGGAAAGLELYLSGALAAAGPGVERIPDQLSGPARERPLALFAELGAVPAWPLPVGELRGAKRPSRVLTGPSTTAFVRAASTALASRLTGCEAREVGGAGLPHVDCAADLADVVEELSA